MAEPDSWEDEAPHASSGSRLNANAPSFTFNPSAPSFNPAAPAFTPAYVPPVAPAPVPVAASPPLQNSEDSAEADAAPQEEAVPHEPNPDEKEPNLEEKGGWCDCDDLLPDFLIYFSHWILLQI